MRKSAFSFGFLAAFLLSQATFGSGSMGTSSGPAAQTGCKTIDAHCVCQNPSKDFKIENKKWGKSNPGAGEEGDCRARLDIDEALKRAPVLFCMSGDSVSRDSRQGQTSCQVTWTCRETCIMK